MLLLWNQSNIKYILIVCGKCVGGGEKKYSSAPLETRYTGNKRM